VRSTPLVPFVKGRFPFKLGTTSYVYPADILTNVRLLAGRVDAVQLVLFEGATSSIPTPAQIKELERIGRDSDLRYIVHFPIDLRLGDPDPTLRRAACDQHCRIADLTASIAQAFVLHADAGAYDDAAIDCFDAAFGALREHIPLSIPACIENTNPQFSHTDALRRKHRFEACIDIGHLLLQGGDIDAHWQRYQTESPLVHLHGCRNGRDHQALPSGDRRVDLLMRRLLMDYHGIVIIELFSFEETIESLEYLMTWPS
jgi:sugar phosphate isomerase/epimerase